mmetsp:Transcript_45602/g.145226  ORF Transcript_45602/g.145226 Transcript_45602/m.145226 type:complete len:219 (+) Transcript_45602:654-1310(+)
MYARALSHEPQTLKPLQTVTKLFEVPFIEFHQLVPCSRAPVPLCPLPRQVVGLGFSGVIRRIIPAGQLVWPEMPKVPLKPAPCFGQILVPKQPVVRDAALAGAAKEPLRLEMNVHLRVAHGCQPVDEILHRHTLAHIVYVAEFAALPPPDLVLKRGEEARHRMAGHNESLDAAPRPPERLPHSRHLAAGGGIHKPVLAARAHHRHLGVAPIFRAIEAP